ncbi:unnamed protein product [Gulo gulo]|uniref:Uncharacterized protein n=1 Tax=Gulo gulo TaxID=48420 RepID=A0A9X9PTN5_GULGU|nr:unnamed protein product [Gulo gulo]
MSLLPASKCWATPASSWHWLGNTRNWMNDNWMTGRRRLRGLLTCDCPHPPSIQLLLPGTLPSLPRLR